MAANLIDPIVKDYLFHDFPLKTTKGKWSFMIISALILVLSVIGWTVFSAWQEYFCVFNLDSSYHSWVCSGIPGVRFF